MARQDPTTGAPRTSGRARGRRARIAWAVLAVTALALGSCGDDDGESTATTATTPTSAGGTSTTSATTAPASDDECTEERRGGTLTMGTLSPPSGIDPVRLQGAGSVGGTEVAAFYDILMQYDTTTGEYSPRVAESLEANDDYTEWTLKLREGVRFGNGDPLDAEAAKRHFERLANPANRSVWVGFLALITSMDVVDDHTLVFHLRSSWPGFPAVLADAPGMVVNTTIADRLGLDAFGLNPQGAGVGPFELARFAPGEEIVFEPKDDYWDGPVCLERLRFIPLPVATTNYEAFKRGEVQVSYTNDAPTAAEVRAAGVQHFVSLESHGSSLLINHGYRGATPPTADVRVRKAIAYAIDVDALNDRIWDGKAIATSALVAEGSRYYQGLQGPPHDPARARALVEEVKAEGTWDGSVELTCTAPSQDLAVTIEGMLEAVGFSVQTEATLTTPDMLGRIFGAGNYQLNCWAWTASDVEFWARLYQNLYSTSTGNVQGYNNPDMDAAIDELQAARDDDEIKRALAKVQEIWNETIPLTIFNGREAIIYWADEVHGLDISLRTLVFFDDTWLEG